MVMGYFFLFCFVPHLVAALTGVPSVLVSGNLWWKATAFPRIFA
jgi:hypothetical protein